jgi:anti-anti-sigma factor
MARALPGRQPDASLGVIGPLPIFHVSPIRADTSHMLKPMVEVKDEGGVLVAEFWDCLRLDPNPVRDLRQHYETHVRSKGKPDLVVDLNGVVFAGSAALGGFLALNRLARQQGGRVVFCNVDENVHEVFRISKLTPMFTFVEDRPAALAFLARSLEDHAPATDAHGPAASSPSSSPSSPPRGDGPLRRMKRRDP